MAKFLTKKDEKKVSVILSDSAYLVRLFRDGLAAIDFQSHSTKDIHLLCEVLQKVNRDNIRTDPAYVFASFYYVKDGLWFGSSQRPWSVGKTVSVGTLYAAFRVCGLIEDDRLGD